MKSYDDLRDQSMSLDYFGHYIQADIPACAYVVRGTA